MTIVLLICKLLYIYIYVYVRASVFAHASVCSIVYWIIKVLKYYICNY